MGKCAIRDEVLREPSSRLSCHELTESCSTTVYFSGSRVKKNKQKNNLFWGLPSLPFLGGALRLFCDITYYTINKVPDMRDKKMSQKRNTNNINSNNNKPFRMLLGPNVPNHSDLVGTFGWSPGFYYY